METSPENKLAKQAGVVYKQIMDTSAYSFDDISLLPRKAVVSSRSKTDVSQYLGPKKFKLPVVPSNMKCVIDEDIARQLSDAGYSIYSSSCMFYMVYE